MTEPKNFTEWWDGGGHGHFGDTRRKAALDGWQAALSAQPAPVPPGYVLVPTEPSIELLEKFVGHGLMCSLAPHPFLVQDAKRKYANWIAAIAAPGATT